MAKLQQVSSVFPAKHSLRARTPVRHECTQVHDEKRSSKLAKSISAAVPFKADKPPLICHSERDILSEVTDFVSSQTLCMHAIAIEAWASGQF